MGDVEEAAGETSITNLECYCSATRLRGEAWADVNNWNLERKTPLVSYLSMLEHGVCSHGGTRLLRVGRKGLLVQWIDSQHCSGLATFVGEQELHCESWLQGELPAKLVVPPTRPR